MAKIKEAKHIFKWFLNTFGYAAITMPWKTIYIKQSSLTDAGLINHEMVHIAQIEKIGPVKFTLMYIWYNIRYGYENNPFEIEARLISGRR
jgi:hypothetical protein